MSPAIWPGAMSKLTPSSATMPPKRTETLRTLSIASLLTPGTTRIAAAATMDDSSLPPIVIGRSTRRMSDCRTDTCGDIEVSYANGPEAFFCRRPTADSFRAL
jgi:hypothetical protein